MGKQPKSPQDRLAAYEREDESEVDTLIKAMRHQTAKLTKADEEAPPPDDDELDDESDDDMGDDDELDDESDDDMGDDDELDDDEEEAPPPPPAKPAKRQAPPPRPPVQKSQRSSKYAMSDDDFLAAMVLNDDGQPVEGASFIDASEILGSLVEGMTKGFGALSAQMGLLEIQLERAEALNVQMAKSLMAQQREIETMRKSIKSAPAAPPASGRRYNVREEAPNELRVNRNTTQGLTKSMVGDAMREYVGTGALHKDVYSVVAGSLDTLGIEGALALIEDSALRSSIIQSARQQG